MRPPLLEHIVADWFRICGVSGEGWELLIHEVVATNEPVVDRLVVEVNCTLPGYYLRASVCAPYLEGNGVWTVYMCSKDQTLGQIHAMCKSAEMLSDDLGRENGETHHRMAALYEVFTEQDFVDTDLTDEIAQTVGFNDVPMLRAGLRHLSSRGVYISFRPPDGEGSVGTYAWVPSFRDHMAILAETRREELLSLPRITVEDFVGRLDLDGVHMLMRLGDLPDRMTDVGPQVRVPADFLCLIRSTLERFVGYAAAAGVLVKVGDSPHGALGGIWRVDRKQYASACELFRAICADLESRRVPQPSSPSAKPPLPRDVAIARELDECRAQITRIGDDATKARPLIEAAEDRVWDLEEQLEEARATLENLVGPRSEDPETLRYLWERIKSLETEQAALMASVRGAANADLTALEQKAHAMGVDPAAYFAALEAALRGRRPN